MGIYKLIVISAFLFVFSNGLAQNIPVFKTNETTWKVFEDSIQKSVWTITPEANPDIYEAYITGKSKHVVFANGKDSIRFEVKPGVDYPFVFLVNEKDSAYTLVKGIKLVPRAHFYQAYRKEHAGKTFVEIPEVYELFNIVLALTDKGKENNGLIEKETPYYQQVLKWFAPHAHDPVIAAINKLLKEDLGFYPALKMDAYAFELTKEEKIVQSGTYDRIGYSNTNFLRPYIPDLQKFMIASKFRKFYKSQRTFYNSQIITFRDSAGLPEMQKWLTHHFPSTRYDSFKIIFSPLVAANQSASMFEDNGFHEAQAHVNFPYSIHTANASYSQTALKLKAGNIVFTELNHSFINPEADKPQYRVKILAAFENLETWNEKGKPASAGYNNAMASFNEYMNWGLVSLRYLDYAPKAEQEKLIAEIEKMMTEYRGFIKFTPFNQFLTGIYTSRKKEQTVADLYPDIVRWFTENR